MATRILFVCLGNICRSPVAESVFRQVVTDAGLANDFVIDSAGTGAWHIGEQADARMREAAAERGIHIGSIARQVVASDFEEFDWIVAMDAANLTHLRRLAHPSIHPKLHLFRDFDPEAPGSDVPDPYYGNPEGFADVIDIVTRTAGSLLTHLRGSPRTAAVPEAPR